ncbi:hypothetical protein EDC96DRAFT_533118 [Choanephora cucurbitarum]|nr:hypothetical protein EDC96DRAFT_533118 [Choanephora cucurbitarum]
MPIPVLIDRQDTYARLFKTILSSNSLCLKSHENDTCLFEPIIADGIVIHILQKESDVLLERWVFKIQPFQTTNIVSYEHVLQFIQDHRQWVADFYTIVFADHAPSDQCYSASSYKSTMEFRSDAQLKAERFQLDPDLSIQVVFDQNPSRLKKPMICLQALSSHRETTLLPWQSLDEFSPLADHTAKSHVSPSHHTPIIAVRRLSRLSLSAIDDDYETAEENDHEESYASIPIPTPHMQYTHHHGHRTTLAYSTSPTNFMHRYHHHHLNTDHERRHSLTNDLLHHQGSFVGSFEESLLSGRMSSMPSKPITFHCQLGVLGYGDCKPSLKCPPHWSIVFPATFYNLPENDQYQDQTTTTPYVGLVDLEEHANTITSKGKKEVPPGYRIPPKGQIQVVIKNPNKTAVKLFLIPYDFTDMPKNTKTFLRQKSYTTDSQKPLLRYAIHLQFVRNERKRIYLCKNMRIVFTNRKADAREKFHVVCEGPKEPVYLPSLNTAI